MSCFSLALIWSLVALNILTDIICNISILPLHLQFKIILIGTFTIQAFYNVNNIRRKKKIDINLGWVNGLRSEESIFY